MTCVLVLMETCYSPWMPQDVHSAFTYLVPALHTFLENMMCWTFPLTVSVASGKPHVLHARAPLIYDQLLTVPQQHRG